MEQDFNRAMDRAQAERAAREARGEPEPPDDLPDAPDEAETIVLLPKPNEGQ
jgi:hypothetical protein